MFPFGAPSLMARAVQRMITSSSSGTHPRLTARSSSGKSNARTGPPWTSLSMPASRKEPSATRFDVPAQQRQPGDGEPNPRKNDAYFLLRLVAPAERHQALYLRGSRQLQRCRALVAKQLARDHQLLDLTRALVDAQGTDLAVEALDLRAFHDAGTSVDLHRLGR